MIKTKFLITAFKDENGNFTEPPQELVSPKVIAPKTIVVEAKTISQEVEEVVFSDETALIVRKTETQKSSPAAAGSAYIAPLKDFSDITLEEREDGSYSVEGSYAGVSAFGLIMKN